MASKSVLTEAITKLVNANLALREKLHSASNAVEYQKYLKEITKNDSMILDYKFRLEHDE
jgi:hypothetical protein